MQSIAAALSDPAVRGWYLLVCFALMVLPMVALAVWYHRTIRKSAGGRALMERQARTPAMNIPTAVERNLRVAGHMARDISAGQYGAHVRRIQNRTYLVVAVWLLVNTIAFGILIWADEVNRATPRAEGDQ